MIRLLIAATVIVATPAVAQQSKPATTYDRAIAAGYKALTYCSGIFLAGRTPAQIDGEELKGIYPEYDRLVTAMPTMIDRKSHSVDVTFDTDLPPRNAYSNGHTGCALSPIGAKPQAVYGYIGRDGIVTSDTPAAKPADSRSWPLGDAGISPRPDRAIAQPVAAAFDRATFGAGLTTALVIVRDGKIVTEHYGAGWGPFVANRTWSVAKSIAGTLIGIAALDPTGPADIGGWKAPGDPRREITLDNLLRMASGLHTDTAGNRTDAIYFGGTAVDEQAPSWPLEAKPGMRFRYANNDILLAVRSMRARLGEDRYDDFPESALFTRLGMAHTWAGTDWRGNYILSSQVWSTARDLARFGMLYLNDGVWNGERVLPEGWVKYVTTPSGPQPEGEFGYGATFWLMNKSPGVPADTFAAFGNRGQYVVIVPSRKIVIVRRGEDPAGAKFDIVKFTADVLAALK